MRRLSGIIIALLAVCAASSAFAHATLLKSDPADGSVLPAAPAQFTLTFNEPVSPIAIRLIAGDGKGTDLGGVEPHNEEVSVPLPPLERGTHTLSWRVVSADGHPVGGSVVFAVGAPSSMAVSTPSATPTGRAVAIWIMRLALYVGLFAGVGGAFFSEWIARQPPQAPTHNVVAAALWLALVGAVGSLGLQGLDLLDAPFPALLTVTPWTAALHSTYALTLALATIAVLLAMTSDRWSVAFALVAVGLALASSGHASDAQPQYLTRPAVFIHSLALTFWIGSLWPLAANRSLSTLQRFSRIAPLPIALLILSGVALAVIQIRSPAAIVGTPYGRVFAAKMTAVAVLLAIAAWNRWRLTPRHDQRALRRSIAVELVLVAVILGLVAAWRFTPPPRALAVATEAAPPIHVHIHGEKAMADVSVAPGRAGPVSISLAIQDGDFGALDAKTVTVTLTNPAAGIEPIRREARHIDGVVWRVDGLTLPVSGTWQAKVDILVTEFSQVTLEAPLTLPP